MLRARLLCTFLLLSVGVVTASGAQDRSRPFFDLSLGPSFRGGAESIDGVYYQRGSGFGLLSLGAQPHVDRSFMFALRVGFLGVPTVTDVCRLTPDFGCYEDFPLKGIIALTAGARPLSGRWSGLELTVGPAWLGRHESGASLGVLAAGRVGTLPGSRFSPGIAFFGIVTTIEGTLVPAGGFGINLRSW